MPCKYLWYQVKKVEDELNILKQAGITKDNPVYQQIYKLRGELFGKLGFRVPTSMVGVLKLLGLSPGEVTIWFNSETGWLAEARTEPGAPPIYHHLDDETAIKLIKGELTKELEERLMMPDDYIGE